MVTSDRPAPPRPPSEIALDMVRRPRFAFFLDSRGVIYCEQVDHYKVVLGCLGQTMGGKPTVYRDVIQWNGDKRQFLDDGRRLFERGFTLERNMAYMTPNLWGAVQVVKEVDDLELGKKFRKILREGTPEGMIPPNVKKYRQAIQPFTDYVLDRITDDGDESTRYYFADRWRDQLTEEEQEYLPKWVSAKG